jgi:xanthine dehydrogenase small subunit
MSLQLTVNGSQVEVEDESASLLAVLREQLGLTSVKDGCSPQGQCGCCTVLVDGAARVACVTPVRRVRDRAITTIEGLAEQDREAWATAFCATGASQCGFCTPGIILRLDALLGKTAEGAAPPRDAIDHALAAHLCRCTGWSTIIDAVAVRADEAAVAEAAAALDDRDLGAASRRATIEGHAAQHLDRSVPLGGGGFADDTAPAGALVAVLDAEGSWTVADTLAEARAAAAKVQGRRTTADARPPIELPPGEWDLTLRTSWVEPAYLETDAAWCEPGGEPSSPLANGGAFGAKASSPVAAVVRSLADEHDRPVRVLFSREDAVRLGPKRPPMAAGIRRDGSGVVRVARTPGVADAIRSVAPHLEVVEVDVPGPPTDVGIRGAGWVEAAVLRAALDRLAEDSAPGVGVDAPNGARARASVQPDGSIVVEVACGDPLDETVLRSYCVGAAHMALSWVTSEAIAVDDAGAVHDLTVRSFGVLRAADMPAVQVHIDRPEPGAPGASPVNGSDAVFAAVAAAVWLHQGCPPVWPTRLPWPDRTPRVADARDQEPA